jgi:hypothetical protein
MRRISNCSFDGRRFCSRVRRTSGSATAAIAAAVAYYHHHDWR